MEKEVYTVKDFCRCYAISRTAFYREVWASRLHVIKRGRRTLVTRLDAEKWLLQLKENQTTQIF